MDQQVAQAIAAIAADNVTGAAEIAERSADVLLRQVRSIEESHEALQSALLDAGWALIDAHPTMAPLVNLVNQVLWRCDTTPNLREMRQAVSETVAGFKRRLRVHEAAIAEKTMPLISEGMRIITIGRSTTVRAALRYAQRAGRRFEVICAEGRPGYEGRALATELADAGIPVKLVIDALAISSVPSTQLVLVGADHLTSEAMANKIGTYGLALAAKASDVPFYALCGSEKFMPLGYTPPLQSPWPGAQVWDHAPDGVTIENRSFDLTPISTLSGIVTEQGVLSAVGIESWLAAIHLHPTLKQAKR